MNDFAGYAGRLLADRYRLPQPPSEEFELAESVAYDTASGQEVLVRQVPLPEVVEAEFVEAGLAGAGRGNGSGSGGPAGPGPGGYGGSLGLATRRPADPAVRRAVEAALAAARVPDHPRLDQVFDVFVEGDGLWIVSELVPARPLAALLAERPLGAHRAAEIGADLLAALRTVHEHGWTHRNITARTVLICEDGRALLTGLAVGAAEEALCGYDPSPHAHVPAEDDGSEAAEEPGGAEGGATPRPSAPPRGDHAAIVAPRAADEGEGENEGGGRHQPEAPQPVAHQIETGRPEQRPPGDPATWTGDALPDGFDAWHGDEPYGVRQRGIFGFEGLPPEADDDEPEPPRPGHGGHPIRHGYETHDDPGHPGHPGHPGRPGDADRSGAAEASAAQLRAARSGAIAAYRAGTRRGAQSRDTQDGPYPQGAAPGPAGASPYGTTSPYTGPSAHGTGSGGSNDWWLTPPDRVPDGQEISPTAFPGTRHGNSHPVHAAWQPPAPGPEAPDTSQDDGDPVGESHEQEGAPGGGEHVYGTGSSYASYASYRGPATALAAERARQARMTLIGPVTERWSPEQAGPVHANWRLAPPVGPAADLWALGALLFRAVQGHAPYPEESVAELVQMVCAEPPAFAEDCGPLRPVVESLMRQDPTERPEFEELRGWLRSLIRSAPEPEAGRMAVTAPLLEPGKPADPRRLPIVRRRGELVRRRRTEKQPVPTRERHRHKRGREKRQRNRSPRSLGRWMIGLVLMALTAAVLYAMWFMPEQRGGEGAQRKGSLGQATQPPGTGQDQGDESGKAGEREDSGKGQGKSKGEGKKPPGTKKPQTTAPAGRVPDGYKLSKDPTGFEIAVPESWDRRSTNGRGQVRYNGGQVEMVIVKGRDSTKKYGKDPMDYQSDGEPELSAYRDSGWASTSGLRRIDVGDSAMAEGTFSWGDSGRDVYARNRALILDGKYHTLLVMGSQTRKKDIDRIFESVADTYRVTH